MTTVRRRLPRDAAVALVVVGWITAVLVLAVALPPHGASLGDERWLGVGTWVVLGLVLRGETRRIRAQVAVVVCFATAVEYTFSAWLGVYVYRLDHVPWFVPPGHGLVYLGALAIGRSQWVRDRARVLIPLTIAVSGGYAFWGLVLSGRTDVLGAFWFGWLVVFLLKGRQPTVFVGAFLVVTYLELLGTHLGVWTWQVRDPIAHLVPMGNPPSGAAGGYGFFDAAALAAAPRIEAGVEAALARVRGWRGGSAGGGGGDGQCAKDLLVQQSVAADHVAAVAALDT